MTRHIQHIPLLVVLKALRAQGHALVQRHVVADDRRLSDHHTRAVVDGEVLANLCPRVDVDTRLRVRQFGDDPRYHGHLQLVQLMGHAVVRHRIHHGVAEDHLAVVRRRRVVVEHRLHVGVEQPLDLGQRVEEFHGQVFRLVIHLCLRAHLLAVLAELQSVGYLLRQQCQQFLHVYADVVRAYRLVGLAFLEVVREDDALHERHDLLHHLHRGQRCLGGGHHAHLLLRVFRQLRHVALHRVVHRFLVHRH